MKAHDDARRDTVRFALAAIQNESVAKRGELDDAAVEAVLRKQNKMRRESIEAFTKGGRAELAAKETKELEILESYLPKQLDEDVCARPLSARSPRPARPARRSRARSCRSSCRSSRDRPTAGWSRAS
jgi:uncharacterized protein